MNRRKTIALIISAVMILAMLAGCGGGGTTPENTTAAPATNASSGGSSSAATTPAETTTIPVVDVAGYDFVIAGDGGKFFPKMSGDSFASKADETFQDKLDEIEARLGCTISRLDLSGKTVEMLNTAGLANESLGDVVYAHQQDYWPAAKAGYLIPLDGEKAVAAGLNIGDEERWYMTTMEWSKLFGGIWVLDCASEYIPAQTGYFVTFNKALCAGVGYADMYKLTQDHMWTWSVYREIAKGVCNDTDGDGTFDIWGTGATAWGNEAVANGVQYIGEVNGKWQCTIRSAAGIEALQFLYDMNFADGCRNDDWGSGAARQAFADGYVAFNWCYMNHLDPGQTITGANHDYGIIPMPMGPRATEYVSMTDNLRGLCIQTANKELDKTVLILNELGLVWNDKEGATKFLDDGRCRTEQDKEMITTYVMPNFALNIAKMNAEIWDLVDEGIISGVSYEKMSPMQAIETYEQKVNQALDAFFGQ